MSTADRVRAARKSREYVGEIVIVDQSGRDLSPELRRAIVNALRNAYCAGFVAAAGIHRRRQKR